MVRAQIAEIAKIAAALFVFNSLKPKISSLTKDWGQWGSLVTDGVAVLLSALIVYVVVDAFTRPKMTIDWESDRLPVRGPCVQLPEVNVGEPIVIYDVFLRCAGESILSKIVLGACGKWGVVVTVSFDPRDGILFVHEIGAKHSDASCSPEVVRFDLDSAVRAGQRSWINVSLQRSNTPGLTMIACQYRVRIGRLNEFWSSRILPVSSEIREFEVRGRV